jgi:hypothetical protein
LIEESELAKSIRMGDASWQGSVWFPFLSLLASLEDECTDRVSTRWTDLLSESRAEALMGQIQAELEGNNNLSTSKTRLVNVHPPSASPSAVLGTGTGTGTPWELIHNARDGRSPDGPDPIWRDGGG